MYGGRALRSGLSVAAMLAVVGAGAAPVTQAATAAGTTAGAHARAGDADLLGLLSSTRWFSPNGDGSRDKVVIGIELDRGADVTVTVRASVRGPVVRTESLGRLGGGDRLWTWNGRDDRGRLVPDGAYRVAVVATRDKGRVRRDQGATRVVARTTYTPSTVMQPQLVVSRDAVYPTTSDFADAVQIVSGQRVKTRDPISGSRLEWVRPAMEVRSSSGRVVHSWKAGSHPRDPVLAWTATTPAGTPLPPGTYSLVARFMDRYGNTGKGGMTRRIQVSGSPLVAQQTWTRSMTAADALTSPPDWYQCNSRDCIETCSPSPSSRTAGALTVRSAQALRGLGRRCLTSRGTFGTPAPFSLGPLDRLTVTANGAEHPVGSTGTVALSLSSAGYVWVESTPGAARTTVGPAFYGQRGPLASPDQVTWSVDGTRLGDTEYELDTFDVQVVRYAPAV